MRNMLTLLLVGGVAAWFFLGNSGGSSAGADMNKVLDRSTAALTVFQKHLETQKVEKVEDKHLQQLAGFMQKAMNQQPPVHTSPVGVALLKDSTFEGFNDPDRDNVKGAGESRLFKVELDFDGKRMIASGERSGSSIATGLAAGLLGGMLMGRLMGNQRAAGVKPGHYANRKVGSRSNYARSRARSGGRFGGK